MNIQEIGQKSKTLLENDEIFTMVLVLLMGVVSFGLGRVSMEGRLIGDRIAQNSGEVKSVQSLSVKVANSTSSEAFSSNTEGTYVASKNGTKYHLPWCSGAKSIKEENKIWFNSKEAAEAAGYTPAANCKGI